MKLPLINRMTPIGYCFFNSRTCVCIVLVVDTVLNKKKAFIGSIEGFDLETDIINTVSWGAKFPSDIANALIKENGTFL